jgi:hypothetical protein
MIMGCPTPIQEFPSRGCHISWMMASIFICYCHSQSVPEVIRYPNSSDSTDTALFRLVVEHLRDSSGDVLRVDPRPLRNDPRLVTLRAFDMIPGRVEPGLWRDPLASVPASLINTRREALRKLRIAEIDGLNLEPCPGVLVPESPKVNELKLSRCPEKAYRVLMVAIPRRGGSYWPGNFDERGKYLDRSIFTVRVIERSLSPQGSSEVSADYVFERMGMIEWRLLERRGLLIVE